MPPKTASARQPRNGRRYLLTLGLLALTYPLLRFLGYRVPRKPRTIEVNSRPPVSGVLSSADFILFDREGSTWAVSRKCTHLGCKVNFHEQGNYLECPCHQSRFSANGEVVRGPAKDNLVVYQVEKRDTAPYYIITA